MAKRSNPTTDIALIKKDIEQIKLDTSEIKKDLESKYVSELEFAPVKNIVYGLVTIILTGVVGAIIALVIRH